MKTTTRNATLSTPQREALKIAYVTGFRGHRPRDWGVLRTTVNALKSRGLLDSRLVITTSGRAVFERSATPHSAGTGMRR